MSHFGWKVVGGKLCVQIQRPKLCGNPKCRSKVSRRAYNLKRTGVFLCRTCCASSKIVDGQVVTRLGDIIPPTPGFAPGPGKRQDNSGTQGGPREKTGICENPDHKGRRPVQLRNFWQTGVLICSYCRKTRLVSLGEDGKVRLNKSGKVINPRP